MNEDEGLDIIVIRLMFTLFNKFRIAKLVTVSHRADEQINIKGSDPFTISLVRALFLQVITRSAAKQVIDC